MMIILYLYIISRIIIIFKSMTIISRMFSHISISFIICLFLLNNTFIFYFISHFFSLTYLIFVYFIFTRRSYFNLLCFSPNQTEHWFMSACLLASTDRGTLKQVGKVTCYKRMEGIWHTISYFAVDPTTMCQFSTYHYIQLLTSHHQWENKIIFLKHFLTLENVTCIWRLH